MAVMAEQLVALDSRLGMLHPRLNEVLGRLS